MIAYKPLLLYYSLYLPTQYGGQQPLDLAKEYLD